MIKFIFGIIGMFIGSAVTVIVMSLLAMTKDTEPPKREPAKLWLTGNICKSGNICKYRGEVYTVVAMTTSKFDNDQTLVLLENDQCETVAPIEELEAVEE